MNKLIWRCKCLPIESRGLMKRRLLASALVTIVILCIGSLVPFHSSKGLAGVVTQALRPNFLIIITDDQSHTSQTLNPQIMPNTQSRIVNQGVLFTRAFCTTPLCSPSRMSIFTGKYGRHHGVLTNFDPIPSETTVYD